MGPIQFFSGQGGSAISDAPILKIGNNPNDHPDVGYLELGINKALEYLKKTACPLERLAISGVGRPLRPTILVGNPKEYVKEAEDGEMGITGLAPTTMGYLTIPLMESEWPDVPHSDPTIHIFLTYPDTPAQQF
jgi:hypothetical protein